MFANYFTPELPPDPPGHPNMLTPTRLLYKTCAAVFGAAAGYVAWAIASRFAFIAGLNDRAA